MSNYVDVNKKSESKIELLRRKRRATVPRASKQVQIIPKVSVSFLELIAKTRGSECAM